jgi:uncharacterized protein involved in response to NO
MTRNVTCTILAGFFYWLLEYGVMELFRILNISYTDIVGKIIYLVVPFLFGAVLIIVIKERSYRGALFSLLLIIVSYAITFVEIAIRYPVGGNPFEATFLLIKIIGVYSILCSVLGGIIGTFFNKKILKREET